MTLGDDAAFSAGYSSCVSYNIGDCFGSAAGGVSPNYAWGWSGGMNASCGGAYNCIATATAAGRQSVTATVYTNYVRFPATAQVTVVNPYTQISGTTVDHATINAITVPTSGIVTVQIYHQDLTKVGDQTVTLEVGTYSSNPANCTVRYSQPSQPVTLSGAAGNVSPTVTVDSPTCNATLVIKASVAKPSSKLSILAPDSGKDTVNLTTTMN